MAQNLSLDEMLDLGPAVVSPSQAPARAGSPAGSAGSAGEPLAIVGEAYEGASRTSQRLALWAPKVGQADDELLPAKPTLDGRVHDTLRNDAYVAGGATIHQDSIVGSLFMLNAKPETRVLFGKDDEVWEREFQEEVETKFTLTAESPNHWLDAARTGTLTDLVRLAVGVSVAGGEVLASAEWMRDLARPCRTAVKLIETERLSDPQDQLYDTLRVRGGVKKDFYGAPEGYYIRRARPSLYHTVDAYQWKYVEARKPWGRQMIFHWFEHNRIEQSRGVSHVVSALKEMRMTKHFRDVVLQHALVQATYAASIESELPSHEAFRMIGGESENPIEDVLTSYMQAISQFSGGARNLTIDGVKIPHLLPGSKLQLRPAGQGGPLGTEFEQSLLRYIAAALGVSYEQLSRDYTNTNYSSARAAMLETAKFMQSRKKRVADRFATFIYRLWLEEAINRGQIETLKRTNIPNWYVGLNADAYSACEWIGAGRGQIDELKETQAAVLRINNNLSTEELEIARLHGGDWRRVKRQRLREQQTDKELGLEKAGMSKDQQNALSGNPAEREATDA